MEDAHTTIPEYKDTKTSFFAVFDGHGGKGTLILLHKEIKKG
jgi:serine/threonine protein phosphatase PrpC